MMTIEQMVAIPTDYRISLELPRSVPAGTVAQVSITIPLVYESRSGSNSTTPIESFRGILKGRGISIEQLRKMQHQDKALEEATDECCGLE